MAAFEQIPIQWGVKLIFDDGTVVNWFRDGRRKTVHAEKNPRGLRFPPSAASVAEIVRVVEGAEPPADADPFRKIDGRPVGAFDGGADPNPGLGGWGVVLPGGGELCGGERHTTNNRMELTAAIRLLEETRGALHVFGDSHYVIAGITRWIHTWRVKGWRTTDGRAVGNRDLWERLDELAAGRDIVWERVPGHAGHPLNERCDRLCAQGRRVAGARAR